MLCGHPQLLSAVQAEQLATEAGAIQEWSFSMRGAGQARGPQASGRESQGTHVRSAPVGDAQLLAEVEREDELLKEGARHILWQTLPRPWALRESQPL